ncbi:MAG: energy-coupling factor transporter ATPase [Christensenella sp.]|nr:energy-coupling factor transporter ATPase [Christensenella sp.]
MVHFAIKNLTFTYPGTKKEALSDVNLIIEKGEYITLCGKSGSGKTTLLRHLKGVLTPHGNRSGIVFLEEKPLAECTLREQSAKIGYVMQNPDSQIVTDKVWHELAFGLESLGCDQKTMRLRVAEMANYFGIQDWFHRNVAELSGGQKQLLNLASIMAMQPEALILDEPTSQLDPIAAADFLNTVRKINLELGTTIVLSEHRLEEVFPCADRVAVMENGRLAALGKPREVGEELRRQDSDMIAALPSSMRIFYAVEGRGMAPLTVRDGRNWLSKEMAGKIPTCRKTLIFQEQEETAAVVLKEVWFRYEKDAPDVLKGVSLAVPKARLFAVVGGNGTGKSTMLKTICGICRPYRGKIWIDGKRIEKYKGNDLFRGMLAMLPQDPQSLFVKKTVEEELVEMLAEKEGSIEEKEMLINNVVRDCEITDLLDMHPYDLSGGEQQRAALAKVLLCEPKVLLLDEPTKGIDNFYKKKLAEILLRLMAKGVTVIMVSHDIEFCAKYADRVAMFFDGGIVTTNTPAEFFAQNSFYTTAANRMSRHVFANAVTDEDVASLYRQSKEGGIENE